GTCEHCGQTFGYWLVHCGFSDCSYAHCDKCGMTAILSSWDKHMPNLNYSRFCWLKKKRCSKRLMNTGFSKNPAFSFGAPKNDILLYTTAPIFFLPTSSHSSRFFGWTDHQ